jgi:uncharacterized protein YycO
MKKKICFVLVLMSFIFTSCNSQKFQDGDMIFQTSKSSQSEMIKQVTGSNLTHCGIIFHKNGKPYVFEAVNPVKVTPLNEWVKRGVGSKYKVTRLNYKLRDNHKKMMYDYAKRQLGKQYDMKFQWSDNKMYCSELVWKIYNASGYTIADPKRFVDYSLEKPIVQNEIKKRYGKTINLNETVVAPIDIYNSPIASEVYSNY